MRSKNWNALECGKRLSAVRLLALDLDGTTLRSDGTLSERTKTALEQAAAQGIHIVVASGRAKSALPEAVRTLKGVEYAVTSNGSSVFHLPTGERVFGLDMPDETVERLMRVLRPFGFPVEIFSEGVAYAPRAYVADPAAFGAPVRSRPYVQATRIPVDNLEALLEQRRGHVEGMDVIVPDEASKRRVREAVEALNDVYITSSVAHYLEFGCADASKAAGLRALAQHLHLIPAQIAAFGDADNDWEMVTFAGVGVAMGNACARLKEAADILTAANDEDGVAEVVEQLLRSYHGTGRECE